MQQSNPELVESLRRQMGGMGPGEGGGEGGGNNSEGGGGSGNNDSQAS